MNQGEKLKFTMDDAIGYVDDYVRRNDIKPTHLFLSKDMIQSVLLSMRDRYNNLSSAFSAPVRDVGYLNGTITLRTAHGEITVVLVRDGHEDFKMLGGPTAYAQYIIKTELLGGYGEENMQKMPQDNVP